MWQLDFLEFIYGPEPKLYAPPANRLQSFRSWFENNESAPPCPECGSRMVLRTAKVGRNIGQQFYGCSKYPNCKGTRGFKADAPATPQPEAPRSSFRPQTAPQATPTAPLYTYAKVIAKNDFRFSFGKELAVTKAPNGDWYYIVLSPDNPQGSKGTVTAAEVQGIFQSFRNDQNKPIQSSHPSIEDLHLQLDGEKPKPTPQQKGKSPLIPSELMSEEQKAIDARFEKLMTEPKQSHIMINALAGSGKTTMLKHLAWKYGSSKQKWLYLVFNTKNKVEATEKFPPWVQVRTTNGFLGEVLQDKKNVAQMPQTERIVNLSKYDKKGEDGGGAKLEKARLLVDSSEFSQVMEKSGIPNKTASENDYGKLAKTVNSLLRSIRYDFKEQVLTLAGLAKSFALDPRKTDDAHTGINKIMDSYDFDVELSDIKERISKYSGSFKANVIDALEDMLGYDFMRREYKNEIISAAKWLMNSTMPHGTGLKHRKGNIDYNLGEFRDFNDDLWFAATHADQINWPHFDVVLADEVQDFNEAQKVMLQKLHQAGSKIVAVGDPNQSIYRFRGADGKAFGNLANHLTDLSNDKNVVFPLSQNFRSRKAILDYTNKQTHVKNLQQGKKFADGHEGTVTDEDLHYDDAFSTLNKEQKTNGKIKQTAFIARTNEPLVHAALKLLANGTPFMIVGKDIARDLKKHIGKIMARFGLQDQAGTFELADKLRGFHDDEHDTHHGKSTKRAYLSELKEVTEALEASMGQFNSENGGDGSIADFKNWLSQKLGGLDVEEDERDLKKFQEKMEKENPVVLTTAHKSKGLEFERVFLLRSDQFPHKKATREEDLEQEANAKYVALTRAMDELHILKVKGQPGVPERD